MTCNLINTYKEFTSFYSKFFYEFLFKVKKRDSFKLNIYFKINNLTNNYFYYIFIVKFKVN